MLVLAYKALVAIILANPSIVALIADRVRPGRLQSTDSLPAVNYGTVRVDPNSTHEGFSGYMFLDLDLGIFGRNYLEASTLYDLLLAQLIDYSGSPVVGITIQRIKLQPGMDETLGPEELRTQQYVKILPIRMFYRGV